MSDGNIKNHATFVWSVADLLRGDYKQSEYGKVIFPFNGLLSGAARSIPNRADSDHNFVLIFTSLRTRSPRYAAA